MDIQAEKLDLIQWLAGINDLRIIKLVRALQKSNETRSSVKLSKTEKVAIDKGLQSIREGRVKTHDDVMKLMKEEFPNLFR